MRKIRDERTTSLCSWLKKKPNVLSGDISLSYSADLVTEGLQLKVSQLELVNQEDAKRFSGATLVKTMRRRKKTKTFLSLCDLFCWQNCLCVSQRRPEKLLWFVRSPLSLFHSRFIIPCLWF